MSTWSEVASELREMLWEDPMEPDYDMLALEEVTSQYQDSYESAEVRW